MTKQPRSEVVAGITITSRHGIQRELVRMRKSVESLPQRLRADVLEFFCDSKAGQHYLIELRSLDSVAEIASFLPPLRAASVALYCGGRWVYEERV